MCKWLQWNQGRYSSLGPLSAGLSLYWARSVLPLPSSSATVWVTQWLRENSFPKLFCWLVHPWIPKQHWQFNKPHTLSRNQRTTGSVVAALDEVWCYRGKWNKPRIHCDHEGRPLQWCLSNNAKWKCCYLHMSQWLGFQQQQQHQPHSKVPELDLDCRLWHSYAMRP